MNTLNHVLPTTYKPNHYNIELFDINTAENSFKGHVDIELNKNTTTMGNHSKIITDPSFITLNIRDIVIEEAYLIPLSSTAADENTPVFLPLSKEDNKEYEELTFQFPTEVVNTKNKFILAIDYKGRIQTNMCGFYRSDFISNYETKEQSFMLSTQFEATDARRAFPCFDEPSLKATFNVTISAPAKFTVLSNMPECKTLNEPHSTDNIIQHVFEKSPLMSTYLVAWAIGDFDYLETFTKNKIYGNNTKKLPIRIYTCKGKSEQGRFALSVAANVIDYFSELLKIPYPLPKIDLLCVESYSHNAMENFSLITFRPTAVLTDTIGKPFKNERDYDLAELEQHSSNPIVLQKIAYVVCHELAHQWFGNLVTMNWWDELWLNEGFATWLGYVAVSKFFPHWDVPSMVMYNSHEVALELDALKESHPIKVSVRNAKDIDQVFDSISYLKGCSILEMISSYIGMETFLQGVTLYLEKNKWKNATMYDLFDCISEADRNKTDVSECLSNWILKLGYPIVDVSYNHNQKEYILTQSRYLSSGEDSDDSTIWWVPLMLKNNQKICMNAREMTINANIENSFFFLNSASYGFYRVNYKDDSTFNSVLANFHELNSRAKIGLISDIESAGDYTRLLNILSKFSDERNVSDDEYYVWLKAINSLNQLKFIVSSDKKSVLKHVILRIVGEKRLYNKLLPYLANPLILQNCETKILRSQTYNLLLTTAGKLSNKQVLQGCRKIFDGEKSIFASNASTVVLDTIMSQEDTTTLLDFEKAKKLLFQSTLADQEIILNSLGSITNPKLFKSCFGLILEIEPMNLQYLAEAWGNNSVINVALWNFFKSNYDVIYKRISINPIVVDRFIRFSFRNLVGDDIKLDFENFFADKITDGFDRGVKQTIERIRRNTKMRETGSPKLSKYVENM
ncbi:M1 family metallopeptidase SCDLUD_004564 [Saccharomycodes ludwigii]|uniref:M1 family metallopeptidase n=1 Tax=Saccharomycodes ludwigii TaxID=36035 RepID=UPI001E82D0FA|nr:hypothetical protein SCDLUD_004564 [Saccharomycodes ludwigii]KAH3899138.1 hypothetical protein SCDLUD_004564 [Saccharomycodes ludwigii]